MEINDGRVVFTIASFTGRMNSAICMPSNAVGKVQVGVWKGQEDRDNYQ